jgi:Zierdtviridae DNA helicase
VGKATGVVAELSPDGKRIWLTFSYDHRTKDTIKYKVPNSRFVPQDKGGPAWSVPLDLATGRILRLLFQKQLDLGPKLLQWGRDEVQRERNLSSFALAEDAELVYCPVSVPELCDLIAGDGTEDWPDRPYQRADIAFMAVTSAINANQMGLGKTIEVIGAIHEAQIEHGEHLIIAPKTALETVWKFELDRFTDIPVFTLYSETSAAERNAMPEQIMEAHATYGGYAFVTTASMVRSKNWRDVFLEANWTSITIDEYHKTGLCEGNSQFSKLCKAMVRKEQKRIPMSGTPMGGKPIKLWAALNFIDPDRFSSKWKWAEQWLDVERETVRVRGGGTRNTSKIGGLRDGIEEAFYAYHAPYLVRRLKSEVASQLPPKQQVEVLCDMTPKQDKQYREFARAAEIRIEELHLSATNILTEYLRLKQFANAVCLIHEVEVACKHKRNEGMLYGCEDCLGEGIEIKQKLIPTEDSGKLPQLLQKLNEIGIDPDDPEGDSQTIIASQFKPMVYMVAEWLEKQGIPVATITGDTKGKDRVRIQREFQSSTGPRVVCMTTTAGGVSITLDRADTCHILDETYRSRDTIEQLIADMTADKRRLNDIILDVHRMNMKKIEGKG